MISSDKSKWLSLLQWQNQLFSILLKLKLQRTIVILHFTDAQRRASVEMILTWAQFSWLNDCLDITPQQANSTQKCKETHC